MKSYRSLLWSAAIVLLVCIGAPGLASAQSADQILAQFDDEPTVLEVQAAALSYTGLDPDRINGWTTRANIANILPERVQYRFRKRFDDRATDRVTEDLNPDGTGLGYEDRREERDDEQEHHEVTVQWDFSELIFNPDVLRVSREIGKQTKLREDLLTTVTKLYYERRRAQIDLHMNAPTDPSERLRKELHIQELTADLDALTGSWFSATLREIGKNPY